MSELELPSPLAVSAPAGPYGYSYAAIARHARVGTGAGVATPMESQRQQGQQHRSSALPAPCAADDGYSTSVSAVDGYELGGLLDQDGDTTPSTTTQEIYSTSDSGGAAALGDSPQYTSGALGRTAGANAASSLGHSSAGGVLLHQLLQPRSFYTAGGGAGQGPSSSDSDTVDRDDGGEGRGSSRPFTGAALVVRRAHVPARASARQHTEARLLHSATAVEQWQLAPQQLRMQAQHHAARGALPLPGGHAVYVSAAQPSAPGSPSGGFHQRSQPQFPPELAPPRPVPLSAPAAADLSAASASDAGASGAAFPGSVAAPLAQSQAQPPLIQQQQQAHQIILNPMRDTRLAEQVAQRQQ